MVAALHRAILRGGLPILEGEATFELLGDEMIVGREAPIPRRATGVEHALHATGEPRLCSVEASSAKPQPRTPSGQDDAALADVMDDRDERLDETTFNAAGEARSVVLHVHGHRTPGTSTRPRTRCRRRYWRVAGARELRGRRAARVETRFATTSASTRCAPSAGLGDAGRDPEVQPYPDRLLDQIAPTEEEPDAVVVARDDRADLHGARACSLPARQRAVLILRDVLGRSAAETRTRPHRRRRGRQQCAAACTRDDRRASAALA